MGKATKVTVATGFCNSRLQRKTEERERAVVLANIAHLAFESVHWADTLAIALREAGAEQADVRRAFILGYAANRLGMAECAAIAAAERFIDLPNNASKASAKRSPEQDNIVSAARMAYSRFLKAHGIVSTGKNSGNSNAKGKARPPKGKANAKSKASKVIEMPKRIASASEFAKLVREGAAMLLAAWNKNASAIAKGDCKGASKVSSAISDIKKIADTLADLSK